MNRLVRVVRAYENYYIYALLITCVVLGVSIAGTFGMGWDEMISDHSGKVTLAYLEHKEDPANTLATDFTKYYGVVVELPFAIVEEKLNLNSHDTLAFRHGATFMLFLIGVYFFYLLVRRRFRSTWFGLLGALFLLINPLIFTGAFYDSKDIPALVFFIISIYTLLLFLERPDIPRALWHALACALLIDTRLPGLFVVAVTGVFIVANIIFNDDERKRWKGTLIASGMYGAVLTALVLLLWPFLWVDPVTNFLAALGDMSHFSRQAGLPMLFEGRTIIAESEPWNYIPVWILITTPIIYLMLFIAGLTASVLRFFRIFFDAGGLAGYYRTWRDDLVVLAWFFGPIAAVIVLHSIVYDSWRQMYFVYPALIYIGLVGVEVLWGLSRRLGGSGSTTARSALILIIAIAFTDILAIMVRNHPNENVYFNAFVGGNAGALGKYEMDYWGLSIRQGLEYIAAHDTQPVIPIFIAGGNAQNILILTPDLQRRFTLITDDAQITSAKYALTTYRFQDYNQMPWSREVYSVKVDGTRIMSVFKAQ